MRNANKVLKLKLQSGFTLIELVIVIIILGVLAVTAAPKFLNIGVDARKASLSGLKASIESTSQSVHIGCQLLTGCTTAAWGQVIFLSSLEADVQILRGYADAGEISRTDQIDDLVEYSGFILSSEDGNETARWSIEGTSNCYVQYRQPANLAGATPTITLVDSGC